MTGAAITELGMQKTQLAAAQRPQAESAAQNNFADFMTKDQTQGTPAAAKDAKAAGSDAKTAYEKSDKKAAENIARDTEQKVSSPRPEKEEVETLVSEDKEQIVQEVAKELDVSEEDVEAAMEVLGLTVVDLMSQAGMTQLIAQIQEVEPVEILTDGDLFAQMESLTNDAVQILTETAQAFDMDAEQFAQLVTEMTGQEQPEAVLTQEDVIADDAAETVVKDAGHEDAADTVREDAPKMIVTDQPIMKQEVSREETGEKEVVGEKPMAGEPVETAKETEQPGEQTEQHQQTGDRRESRESGMKSENAAFLNNVTQPQQMPVQPMQADAVPEEAQMPRTQEIIDQIADYVRVHRSEQITEMEISLNPASLGNIHLQVASKAGTVSAQLIAQDQAVAAALESQIVMLKEALEAQGMRVDAVEVTVSSHAFEQNLDQQGREQEQEAQRASAKKGQRRILDLDEVDGMEDEQQELSDAERLQVEMMRMGGNRMNYQI